MKTSRLLAAVLTFSILYSLLLNKKQKTFAQPLDILKRLVYNTKGYNGSYV